MTLPRAVVVEDEGPARRMLCRLLRENDLLAVEGEASSAAEAVRVIDSVRPDVVLLDVELGDGTGFDVLDRIACRPRVVFVTAYDAHAVRAFEVQAVDYVLKPITVARLERTVGRLRGTLADDADQDTVALHTAHGLRLARLADLVLIRAQADYTEVHLRDGTSLLSNRTMKTWQAQLRGTRIARVHRSYFVRLAEATAWLRRKKGGALQLVLGGRSVEVPVSASRRAAVERIVRRSAQRLT